MNEINNLKILDHPNILRMYESYECDKRYYIVTDISKGGELFDEIAKNRYFTEPNAQTVIKALTSCISYIHYNGILHRDLKPENILLKRKDKSGIVVADFGSGCLENEIVYTYIQSRFYRAPDIILGLFPYTQ